MIPGRLPLRAAPSVPVFALSATDRSLRIELIAGSHATVGYEPRQVRKEAAAVTDPVCRGEAQLSVVSAISFRNTPRFLFDRRNHSDTKAAIKRRLRCAGAKQVITS